MKLFKNHFCQVYYLEAVLSKQRVSCVVFPTKLAEMGVEHPVKSACRGFMLPREGSSKIVEGLIDTTPFLAFQHCNFFLRASSSAHVQWLTD